MSKIIRLWICNIFIRFYHPAPKPVWKGKTLNQAIAMQVYSGIRTKWGVIFKIAHDVGVGVGAAVKWNIERLTDKAVFSVAACRKLCRNLLLIPPEGIRNRQ